MSISPSLRDCCRSAGQKLSNSFCLFVISFNGRCFGAYYCCSFAAQLCEFVRSHSGLLWRTDSLSLTSPLSLYSMYLTGTQFCFSSNTMERLITACCPQHSTLVYVSSGGEEELFSIPCNLAVSD